MTMPADRSAPTANDSVLVTGATGFVGGHLVRALLEEGRTVHAVLRPSSDPEALRDLPRGVIGHTHDGSTAGLVSIVRAAHPGIVFHLASRFVAEHQSEDVEPLVRGNLLFGSQLLEAMTACNVRALVNTGTSWQHYGGGSYSPVCLYAATKQAYEAILQFYVEARHLRVITLKLFETYGPRDRRPKLLGLLRKALISGEPLAMSGGEQLLDLVHVDDVVAAYLVAARRVRSFTEGRHEIYSVHSGEPIRLKDLVELYFKLGDRSLDVSWGSRPYREREVMTPWNEGAWLPGWRPTTPLRKGLQDLIEAHDREDRPSHPSR
jgi:nucleoside-diphosphate-sugar epimerase